MKSREFLRTAKLTAALLLVLATASCGGSSDTALVAASWQDQLHAAEAAVGKIASDSLLVRVSAYPHERDQSLSPKSMDVTFLFAIAEQPGALASGVSEENLREVNITLEDTAPSSTIGVIGPYWGYTQLVTPMIHDEFSEALKYVSISPAEALSATVMEGKAFAQQYGSNIESSVYLLLGKERLSREAIPQEKSAVTQAVWSVSYSSSQPFKQLFINVDAQTGTIINQWER